LDVIFKYFIISAADVLRSGASGSIANQLSAFSSGWRPSYNL